MEDLIINKYEVVLFLKDFYLDDLNAAFVEIKKISSFKGGTGSVLPIPHNSPREIPRILIDSPDSSLKCTISFEKISLIWQNLKEELPYKKSTAEIQTVVGQLTTALFRSRDIRIKRIGYIKEIFFITEDPIKRIPAKIVSDPIKVGLEDFLFQFVYPIDLDVRPKSNELIQVGSGSTSNGNKKRTLMLMSDINTHATEDVDWDMVTCKSFIEEAGSKSTRESLFSRFLKQDES